MKTIQEGSTSNRGYAVIHVEKQNYPVHKGDYLAEWHEEFPRLEETQQGCPLSKVLVLAFIYTKNKIMMSLLQNCLKTLFLLVNG